MTKAMWEDNIVFMITLKISLLFTIIEILVYQHLIHIFYIYIKFAIYPISMYTDNCKQV